VSDVSIVFLGSWSAQGGNEKKHHQHCWVSFALQESWSARSNNKKKCHQRAGSILPSWDPGRRKVVTKRNITSMLGQFHIPGILVGAEQ
jgi:hypothetical protein